MARESDERQEKKHVSPAHRYLIDYEEQKI